jgi:hypothetical protein
MLPVHLRFGRVVLVGHLCYTYHLTKERFQFFLGIESSFEVVHIFRAHR